MIDISVIIISINTLLNIHKYRVSLSIFCLFDYSPASLFIVMPCLALLFFYIYNL